MILNRERNIGAEKIERIELAVFIERVAGTAAEGDHSCQTASSLQRSKALEQFRCDVAVGTDKDRIRGRVENDRSASRNQRVNVFGKERNEGGIRHQREAQRRRGRKHRGLVVEQKKRTFARACCFHDGRQH